jgi:DNA topoisomerase-3
VCATDAGREGEHIFRLIYRHTRCRKPFERLWVSSLTDEAIRAGFAGLRPGRAYADLAAAAEARAQADWLVGMNLTRAYTVHNRVLCTIGRVQTPTLAMIVVRDAAIDGFTKAFFYELVARLAEGFSAKYLDKDGETRIEKKAEAERLHTALAPHRTGTVRKVEKKVRRNRPPTLYDLTNLQRDANRRFGLTAAQVLEAAQALYETHKVISYPRTESRHIGEDMLPKLPGILERLTHPLAPEALERWSQGFRPGKAYVDQTKLTDHHAILPTGKRTHDSLSEAQRRVYELVAARFVAVFLPDQVVEETRVALDIGGATFLARGSVVLDPGWKRVEPPRRRAPRPRSEGAEEEPDQALPPLEVGQTVQVESLDLVEKETLPPRPYDDATLLAAMKNAGRDIDDEALATAMKDSGLGTPATRAEIIEKLIRTGYVVRERKALRATDKGKALIALVAGPLKSPELTGEWERQLKEVEQGERPATTFYADIVAFVRELVPRVAGGPAMSPEQVAAARASATERPGRGGRRGRRHAPAASGTDLGTCPQCRQGAVVESPKAFGCSRYRDGCGFTIWKTVAGHVLGLEEVKALIAHGRTGPIAGFRSKAGRPFSAALRIGEEGKVQLDFAPGPPAAPDAPSGPDAAPGRSAEAERAPRPLDDRPPLGPDVPLTCPKCGQGHIIEGRRGFGCDRYREGCHFVIWKEVGGLTLTRAQVAELLLRGRTGLVRGLTDPSGRRFDARLRLEGERVLFDFADR